MVFPRIEMSNSGGLVVTLYRFLYNFFMNKDEYMDLAKRIHEGSASEEEKLKFIKFSNSELKEVSDLLAQIKSQVEKK